MPTIQPVARLADPELATLARAVDGNRDEAALAAVRELLKTHRTELRRIIAARTVDGAAAHALHDRLTARRDLLDRLAAALTAALSAEPDALAGLRQDTTAALQLSTDVLRHLDVDQPVPPRHGEPATAGW